MSGGFLSKWRSVGFAAVLLVVLLVINLFLNPARFYPGTWGALIGLAAGHVAAALYHQWILRDALIARMMPGRDLEGSI